MDVDAIQPGRDFRRAIDENIAECSVLLAVIGLDWFDSKDSLDRRRLDDPDDSVRLEIASALRRDIPVVPVLVQGARMPRAEQLPSDLRDLAYRNAVELTHARWKSDLQILVKALLPHIGNNTTVPKHFSKRTVSSPPVNSTPVIMPAAGIEPAAAAGMATELSQYIGPIAEILVRRAAKRCSSLTDLSEAVAEEIESPADREKFLEFCRRLQSTFTARPTS